MKSIKLAVLGLGVASLLSVTLLAESVSEESLGLRKTDLYSEKNTTADKTSYSTAAAGTSQKIERAFENAPPMIPHSVEGLLPITVKNNACLGCHMPEVAPNVKATSIPKSHFTDFRPTVEVTKEGELKKSADIMKNEVVATELKDLSKARFNCSQCHTPQSDNKPLVENKFEADFRTADGAKKSNLLDTLNEGVK